MLDMLDRLRAAASSAGRGEFGPPGDGTDPLGDCAAAVVRLEQEVTRVGPPAAPLLALAQQAWKQSEGRIELLSARHVRSLCWEPAIVWTPQFLAAVDQHQELQKNRRWIEGLIDCYFAKWGVFPHQWMLERTLRRVVLNFRGKSSRIEACRPIADDLFSGEAPRLFASEIVDGVTPIKHVLDKWQINASSGLGEAVAGAAVKEWAKRFGEPNARWSPADAMLRFQHLVDLLTATSVSAHSAAEAVGALVTSAIVESSPELQAATKTYLLTNPRFGDPRLPGRQAHWALVSSEAKQRVIGWMAKADLLFFFQSVITDDPHGRRDFWLRYIERAVDARVALSDEDALRLKAQVRERLSYSKATGGGGTSAFIMRFKGTDDVICAEFSRAGNALYIHDTGRFIERHKSIRMTAFDVPKQLKDARTAIVRHIHRVGWQWELEHWLRRIGVRPVS